MLKTHSPGPCCFRPGLDQLDRLLARLHAVEAQLLQPGLPGAEQVHVVVDQSRDDGLSPQVDPPRVLGPASRVMSWLVPTATMRSPRIATACAIVKRSSTVMTFPFDRMRSGAGLLRTQQSEQPPGDDDQHADAEGARTRRVTTA